MVKITFFRQKRRDGAVRSGIDVDGETLWHRLESTTESESDDGFDPVLSWFVDLEFIGEALPFQPHEARQWLLDHANHIQDWLQKTLEPIRAGFDMAQFPLIREQPEFETGVHLLLRLSAVRRAGVRELMDVLSEIATHMPSYIEELSQPSLV